MKFYLTILLLLILIFNGSFTMVASAAPPADGANQVAVLLVMDNSGSMSTSDPSRLRLTASRLFVSLLDQGDAVGVIRFSTPVTRLTDKITPIQNEPDKKSIIQKITVEDPNGWTHVKEAFDEAKKMLAELQGNYSRTVVVFLTDGLPQKEALSPADLAIYTQDCLNAGKALGVPVQSIALTTAGESPFLNQLASETGGSIFAAKDANGLVDAFLKILGDLKDRTVLAPDQDQVSGQVSITLPTDLIPYVSRVSFIVSKPSSVDAVLIGPDGKEISPENTNLTYSDSDARYRILTVSHPGAGSWKFKITGGENVQVRAILHSTLRTRVIAPVNLVEAGPPFAIVVRLIEEQSGKPPANLIGEASFSAVVTWPDGTEDKIDRFYDDGTNGDRKAGDGDFTHFYVNTIQPGTYKIRVHGLKSGVVPVEYETQVQAVPFPQIKLDLAASGLYESHYGAPMGVPIKFHLEGVVPAGLDQGDFVASVKSPGGKIDDVNLKYGKEAYQGEYNPQESGAYTVEFKPIQAVYQGLPYTHSASGSFNVVFYPWIEIKRPGLLFSPPAIPPLLDLQDGIDKGIGYSFGVESHSAQPVTLIAALSGLPGFIELENNSIAIGANDVGSRTLQLRIVRQAKAGDLRGQINFKTEPVVDLKVADQSFEFNLHQPAITATAKIISQVSPNSCLAWAPVKLVLDLTSTSLKPEVLKLDLSGIEGGTLDNPNVVADAGTTLQEVETGRTTHLELEIKRSAGFSAGTVLGSLQLTVGRTGVNVLPQAAVPLTVTVDPLWVSCAVPLKWIGVGLLALILAGIGIRKRIVDANREPLLDGTLLWKPVQVESDDNNGSISTVLEVEGTKINLSNLKLTEAFIGSDQICKIHIVDESINPKHATLIAEKGKDRQDIYIKPIGEVTLNGSRIFGKKMLKHKDVLLLGKVEIKYLANTLS